MKALQFKTVFHFWTPLCLQWLVMGVEGPIIAATIARFTDVELELAAYGLTYTLALLAEAPVIMLLSASTKLVDGAENYKRVRNFSIILSAGVTICFLIFLIPPVFEFLIENLAKMNPDVANKSYRACWVFLPWAGSIGMRRFYHGVLIRNSKPRLVFAGTLIRIAILVGLCFFSLTNPWSNGATIGAMAITSGVLVEALLTRLYSSSSIRNFLSQPSESLISWSELISFYLPLALMAFIGLAAHPLVVLYLGHAPFPVESLAVIPVINGLGFFFRTFGLSFQEVAIAMMGKNFENQKILSRFALVIAVFSSGFLFLIVMTPLDQLVLMDFGGLSRELAHFAWGPLAVLSATPALTVWITWERAKLVMLKRTHPVSIASLIEVVSILVVVVFLTKKFQMKGALAAAIAYVIGRLLACGYLKLKFLSFKVKLN